MKKLIPLLIVTSSISLYACSSPEVEEQTPEKTSFNITTTDFGTLSSEYNLKKSSKIEASSEVVLSSETMGRVSSISVKEGDSVDKGQQLVYLSDSSLNLNNSYQQALLNLEQAKIAYESNKVNLDKAVFDTDLQVENLQNTLDTTKLTIEQNLKQAKDNLENANAELEDSKSALDLQKIENSIAKMELDYENQVSANEEQINNYKLNLEKEKKNLDDLMTNVILFGDDLFRVSTDRSKADYDVFLGAQAPLTRNDAENTLRELMSYKKETFEPLELKDTESIQNYINELENGFSKTKKFLDYTQLTLNNSIVSVGKFSETQKQQFISQVNGYISNYQGLYASFLANKNAATTFLNTYESQLESIRKQIDLAEKDLEITKKSMQSGELSAEVNYEKLVISSKDQIRALELQLKNAENALENAKQTRDISLKNLNNSIKNAELAVQRAGSEVSKLVVTAPISGVVADIMVNEGQTYPNGTQFLKILSSSKRELDVFVPEEDLAKINIGDKATIDYRGESFEGEVFSKSTLADKNLNYRVKVALDKDINLVGGIADVSFRLQAEAPLIPINAIEILQNTSEKKTAEIHIYQDGTIKDMTIDLGDVYGKFIEVLSPIDNDTTIILNDISNFNEEKNTIIVTNDSSNTIEDPNSSNDIPNESQNTEEINNSNL